MKKLNSVRTIILAGSLLLQLNTLCFQSRGAAGDVDLSFDPGSGVNGLVKAVLVQSDGKAIIAGDFTTVKGLARAGLARLNADGSGDATFNANKEPNGGVPYIVSALALQSDGKVLIGGGNGIVRLNANGSLDSSFNPVVGTDWGVPWITSIVLQSDGKALIVGSFTKVNGTNRAGIARLNANGSLDSSFNPGTNGGVFGITLQPDGKVVIGGAFYAVNGTFRNHMARLNANGSLDGSFNPGTGANDFVRSMALQTDGKVLIGGYFTTVNGTNRNGIARLNANGTLDTSFNPGTGVSGGTGIMAFVVQSDGKVLITGAFTTVNGTSRKDIARLNADGSLDNSFNPDFDHDVSSVALQPDGKVLIGGSFSYVNGTNRNRIARLNANGSVDSSFDPGAGLDSSISSLVAQPNGKVLIGGVYTFINGTNRYGSQLNADGSPDSTFIPSSFNPEIGVPGTDLSVPNSLLVQSDGKVLIGGYTDTVIIIDDWDAADSFGTFLARFNANGSLDGSFNGSVIGPDLAGDFPGVFSLAVQADGKVLIGGRFAVNGTNSSNIVRLNADGSLDSSFNLGTVAYGNINSIVVQSDGKVLIGGDLIYNYVNDTNYSSGIARLNANGSLDSTFNPGTGIGVASIAVQSDCKILIGGYFTAINGTNRNNIARLNADGSLDTSFNPGTGADGVVRSIALQPDGNVLIGGDFTIVNGAVRPRVARLYGDSVAPSLNIARSNAFVIVSWPSPSTGFVLQQNIDLKTTNWTTPSETTTENATTKFITVSPAPCNRFYRLFKP